MTRAKVNTKAGLAMIVVLFISACASQSQYSSSDAAVLVNPTKRGWLKPDSTMEDESQAKRECGQELRASEELRAKGVLSDEWTDAAHACMTRKGFSYYKKRKRSK